MTAKSDYAFNVGLVRKNHMKANQIRGKSMNVWSLVIIEKWWKLSLYLQPLVTISIVKSVINDYYDYLLPQLNYLSTYHKEAIAIEDYESIFYLLRMGLFISILALLFE